MTKALEVIRAMWPTSVPAQDYEKMLRLVGVLGANTEPTTPIAPTRSEKKARASYGHGTYATVGVSEEVMDEVRTLLASGPATVQEIAETLGAHCTSVRAAIVRLGGVAVGKQPRPDGTAGAKATIWGLPEKRAP